MNLLSINRHIQNGNWSMTELHSHPHYEIYFLYEGERRFFLNDALYNLFAPCIVVIEPYVLHKTEGGAFKRINIDVLPEYLNQYQKDVLEEAGCKILVPKPEEKAAFLRDMLTLEGVKDEENHSSDIKNTLFSYIIYNISLLKAQDKTLYPINRNRLPENLLLILDYINKNYRENITLNSLSEKFFLSKASIIYNFNHYLNFTPIDYLLNLRLNKARDELLTTKKTISEISEGCGFSSPNYFSFIFKKKEGISPLGFRKSIK